MRRDKLSLIKWLDVTQLCLPVHLLLQYLENRITDAFWLTFRPFFLNIDSEINWQFGKLAERSLLQRFIYLYLHHIHFLLIIEFLVAGLWWWSILLFVLFLGLLRDRGYWWFMLLVYVLSNGIYLITIVYNIFYHYWLLLWYGLFYLRHLLRDNVIGYPSVICKLLELKLSTLIFVLKLFFLLSKQFSLFDVNWWGFS